MDRPIFEKQAIECVDYDAAYAFGGEEVDARSETLPQPLPRGGENSALIAPLPWGGAGGGVPELEIDHDPHLTRDPSLTPHTFGPLPLLDLPLQALFAEHLARHGNVRLACKAARVSPQTAYRMRRASARFRQLWNAALVVARDQVEDVLADRAVNGWEEAVFYHGEEVARRRRYDARLLLAHLERLDKLAEREGAGQMVTHFDDVLEAMAQGEELDLPEPPAPEEAAVAVAEVPAADVVQVADDEDDDDGDGEAGEAVPLLEAQLRWLEARHGRMTEEQEIFHLLHTVPGVPGAEFRRFGWRGRDDELVVYELVEEEDAGPAMPGEGAREGVTTARC